MPEHPPLSRVPPAVALYMTGSRWSGNPNMYLEGYLLLGQTKRYGRALFFSRLAALPFFWVASAVVFLWTSRIAGPGTAVLSVLLFTTTPPVLAHAGLVTADMALAAFVGAAALGSLFWAEKPDWKRSLLLGTLVGLAALSKFTALAFLPAVWLAMAAVQLARSTNEPSTARGAGLRRAFGRIRKLAPWSVLSAALAALLIWAAYRFTFGPVELLHASLPAPAFFTGIESSWEHNRIGHLAYLLGQRRSDRILVLLPGRTRREDSAGHAAPSRSGGLSGGKAP